MIVLCRDWANTDPTVRFEFPEGYDEPNVVLERFGTDGGEDVEEGDDNTQDTANP